jgi:hypothetical protein
MTADRPLPPVPRDAGAFPTGAGAPQRATARALARVPAARAVVLVEGTSDHVALETLAVRRDRDLAGEGVVILPVGGAHAVERYLRRFGPAGAGLTLAGLCDAAEEPFLRRALTAAGLGSPSSREEMAALGFHVCVADLEDELIRAVGVAGVEAVFEERGDLGSFRTLQQQPGWRGRHPQDQMRRFLGSGARRKLRYARYLVEALDLDRVPRPLQDVLAGV